MSRHDPMKNKYSAVVDEIALERLNSSFSNSFSTTFSNPFTTISADTTRLNGDNSDSRHDPSELHPQWPKEPLTLKPLRAESILLVLYDVILFLIPVLLTVKVALVVVAWHTDKDHLEDQVDQTSPLTLTIIRINQQMVTVFTMIFAAIVSTVLRRYAVYQAQEGASLGKLEQFYGSTSLLATLHMMWGLRSFGRTSVVLLLIWSLYYLGSQASSLEYRLTDSDHFSNMVAAVPTNNAPSVFSWPDITTFSPILSTISQWNTLIFQLCGAALWYYLPGFTPGADIVRSAIIPDLKFLTGSQLAASNNGPVLDADQHGWYDVSRQSWIFDRMGYSSLAGWPVAVYNGSGNMTERQLLSQNPQYIGDYTFSPTYFSMDCSGLVVKPFNAFPDGTMSNQTISFNMTPVDAGAPMDNSGNLQRNLEVWVRAPEVSTLFSAVSYCNVSQLAVDLKVNCQATSCFPQSMRWAKGNEKSATSFATVFDDPTFATTIFDYMSIDLNNEMPLLLAYVFEKNSSAAQVPAVFDSLPYDAKIPIFVSRLVTIFTNSFYLASLRYNYNRYTLEELVHHSADFNMTTTPFRGALSRARHKIYWGWIAIDLICCLVLLVAAATSVILRMRTMVPDIFGSVSSLTRPNPDFYFPSNGTSLSGLERARLMKQVQVKLGDLSSGNDEVGRIGLARVDVGGLQVRELSKNTKYS